MEDYFIDGLLTEYGTILFNPGLTSLIGSISWLKIVIPRLKYILPFALYNVQFLREV